MSRSDRVVDADGHMLGPLSLSQDYMDPSFRDRAARLIRDTHGQERRVVERQVLGSQKDTGALVAVGARDGAVVDDTMEYAQAPKGGFNPHARISAMDRDGIDAALPLPQHRPVRRRAPYHHPHHGNDAGLSRRHLGRRVRAFKGTMSFYKLHQP